GSPFTSSCGVWRPRQACARQRRWPPRSPEIRQFRHLRGCRRLSWSPGFLGHETCIACRPRSVMPCRPGAATDAPSQGCAGKPAEPWRRRSKQRRRQEPGGTKRGRPAMHRPGPAAQPHVLAPPDLAMRGLPLECAMKMILLADSSQTRRRALSAALSNAGFGVTAVAELGEVYDALMRDRIGHGNLDAVVLGWPEYSEGVAEDVFGLLQGERFEHLPVLVMADSSNANAVNWRMSRPRTALTFWSEYQEAPNAVGQLLRPGQSIEPARSANHQQIKVLLVDDSATVRAGYSKLLQKHGYHTETAESVAEGWKKISEQDFDIAIIDYLMPVQNGTALITRIRNEPRTQHILTATITGTYSDAVIAESLACGALECLFKSESKDLLLARLASLARTINDQKAIDKERRRLQDILSSLGEGVYGVDADGVIQFINPAALDLLGYTDAADLIGQCAFDVFHYAGEDGLPMQRAASYLNTCYANGSEVSSWQTRFWTACKRGIPVECNIHPLRLDS